MATSLSREAIADWLSVRYGQVLELDSDQWLDEADEFAVRFKLPLDADGPGITRCRCGHPIGDHRNGEDACRGTVISGNVASACKCKKARVAA